MRLRRAHEIARFADEVRRYLGFVRAPHDPKLAVARLKGRLILTKDRYEIRKIEGDSFEIYVDDFNPFIAAAIGHLFLTLGYLVDPVKWKGPPLCLEPLKEDNGQEEQEADLFGQAFLMPTQQFQEAVNKVSNNNGVCDLSAVANHFKVPLSTAYRRGQALGIFDTP